MNSVHTLRRAGRTRRSAARLAVVIGLGLGAVTACGPVSRSARADWSDPATASPSPSAAASVPPASPPNSPTASAPSAPATGGPYVFPITGNAGYEHTHHDYPASDIIAACGLPVRAVTNGVILEVNRVDKYNAQHVVDADKGGISVSLLGDDGVRYYGSHLSTINAGIEAGVRVAAGAQLGLVGRTGNAGACHLHFGISPVCQRTGDWWVRRGEIWPWSYLDAWRSGQPKSPYAEVTAWQRTNGCPASAPTN